MPQGWVTWCSFPDELDKAVLIIAVLLVLYASIVLKVRHLSFDTVVMIMSMCIQRVCSVL